MSAEGNFSTPLPKSLQKHRAGLTAEVEVLNESGTLVKTVALAIDLETHQVSGRIDGLLIGNYIFTIRYHINGVLVAEQATTGIVNEDGETAIAFDALEFPDEDGDGFTNLAEVQFGSNPLVKSSKPPAEIFRFSSSYAMTDTVGSGAAVEGRSTSLSFIMISGL